MNVSLETIGRGRPGGRRDPERAARDARLRALDPRDLRPLEERAPRVPPRGHGRLRRAVRRATFGDDFQISLTLSNYGFS